MTKYFLIFIVFLSLFSFNLNAQSSFSVSPSGTDSTIEAAIEFTTAIWEHHLVSPIPIKVNLFYANLSSAGPLAITFPNGRKDFDNAPLSSTWYPSCLANSLSGQELNPGEADMDIYVNSFFNFYFGLDGNPPSNQYDFVSLLLHEICHGLGFLSLAKVENTKGSFGRLDGGDFVPLTTTFPFPQLEGLPSAFDVYLVTGGDNGILTDTVIFPNDSDTLRIEFTSNDVFYNGPEGVAANYGTLPRIFAPSTYAIGTSITHLNESSFPPGDTNSLMTPFLSAGEVEQHPGPIVLGVLKDIGWPDSLVISSIKEPEIIDPNIIIFPNPFTDHVIIHIETIINEDPVISLFNIQGLAINTINPISISKDGFKFQWTGKDESGQSVPNGIYIFKIVNGIEIFSGKIQKFRYE